MFGKNAFVRVKKCLLYLKVYRECVSLQQPLDGKNTVFPSCLI